MGGLWRVDFKPSSWLRRTRVLTPEERGVYIDLIMMIYERGGPIPDVAEDLCRELGFRYRAKLEKVLAALERRGKIWRREGSIGNPKAMEVLARLAGDQNNEAGAGPARPSGEAKPGNKARKAADQPALPGTDAERHSASLSVPECPSASLSVGRASGGKIQSNQGPPSPPYKLDSYKESSTERPSLPAANDRGIGASDAACRELIRAFDDAIAAEWGETMRRQMPPGRDYQTARSWLAAGADAALVADVARRQFARMHDQHADLPRMLSVLDREMQVALEERRHLRAKGPVDPERKKWDSRMHCFVKGQWLEAWGPAPGMTGCQMPKHLQDECISNRAA